jgi:hypothetical protein
VKQTLVTDSGKYTLEVLPRLARYREMSNDPLTGKGIPHHLCNSKLVTVFTGEGHWKSAL